MTIATKTSLNIKLRTSPSVLRFIHVGHVVTNKGSVLSLNWNERFLFEGREWKIFHYRLALSSEPQI